MRIRKRNLFFVIARIVAMFFVVAVAAALITVSRIDLEDLRGDILSLLRTQTGLPIEIDGGISWKFSLRPRVALNGIRVPNADWAAADDGFVADRVEVVLDLVSLLQSAPAIRNVTVFDAVLNLEKNAGGEYSIAPDIKPRGDNADKKYPFETNLGFAMIDVENAKINSDGKTYNIDTLRIGYYREDGFVEYRGMVNAHNFSVRFSEYNADRKVYPVRAQFDNLIANIALEGTSFAPIDFTVTGVISELDEIPRDLRGMNLNIAGGIGDKKITLRKSNFTLRGTEFTLAGGIDWSGKIPDVKIDISAGDIDIMKTFPEVYGTTKWVRPNRPLNAFKDIPLYGDRLLKINLDFKAQWNSMAVYRELVIKNTAVSLTSRDARARLDVAAEFMGGEVVAGADVDIDPDGTLNIRAGGVGTGVRVGDILAGVRHGDIISGLPTNLEFYVRGRGADLSHLMGSLTGPAFAYSTGAGRAHSMLVENMYGTDFLTDLRHGISDALADEKRFDHMEIECAAANLKIRRGIAETRHGVAMQTNALNLRMVGGVNMATENMRISMVATPVRGLKLSLTGGVMDTIEIVGNMSEPDITLNGGAVVGKVATATGIGLLLAPFTGGLSVLAGAGVGYLAGDMLENWLADPMPCRTAMNEGAPREQGDPRWMNRPMADLLGTVIDMEKIKDKK